jgi:DNA repair exonuclease SbcCD ATPase subunit
VTEEKKPKSLLDVVEDSCGEADGYWWVESVLDELGLDDIPADVMEQLKKLKEELTEKSERLALRSEECAIGTCALSKRLDAQITELLKGRDEALTLVRKQNEALMAMHGAEAALECGAAQAIRVLLKKAEKERDEWKTDAIGHRSLAASIDVHLATCRKSLADQDKEVEKLKAQVKQLEAYRDQAMYYFRSYAPGDKCECDPEVGVAPCIFCSFRKLANWEEWLKTDGS